MNKLLTTSLCLTLSLAVSACSNLAKETEQKEPLMPTKTTAISKEKGADEALSLKIADYLKTKYLDEADLRVISKEQRRFQFSTIDLNGDGVDEIFVYLNSTYFCGSGGCNFLVMDNNLKLITEFTVTRPPILVSKESENNWKKLYLLSDGYREMTYSIQNKSYPTNPSLENKVNSNAINQEGTVKLFDSEKQANIYY